MAGPRPTVPTPTPIDQVRGFAWPVVSLPLAFVETGGRAAEATEGESRLNREEVI